jgi:FkbM family methyltransferase
MKTFNEFSQHIKEALLLSNNEQENIFELLNANSSIPKFFIGRNSESLELIKVINFAGVIDDFTGLQLWEGVNVVKSSEVPRDCIVINCSTSISPVQVHNKLKNIGIKNLVTYGDLISSEAWGGHIPQFVLEMRNQLETNLDEWYSLYKNLADSESQAVFLNLILYRGTANLDYMNDFEVRFQDQYFEEFMAYEKEVLVDIGGYNGDTTEIFCHKYPNYQKVHFFEPSEANMNEAKSRLSRFSNIKFHQQGVSNKEEKLYFNSTAGSCSSIQKTGEDVIQTIILDNHIDEPVTFIKMDIEGWELNALEGCKNHIRDRQPKLAIAAYHRTSDFLEIPKYILSLSSKYKIYLRHYTSGWSESVLYFLPT